MPIARDGTSIPFNDISICLGMAIEYRRVTVLPTLPLGLCQTGQVAGVGEAEEG